MKITANFVEHSSRYAKALALAIGLSGSLLLLLALYLWTDAARQEDRVASLTQRLSVQQTIADRMAASAGQPVSTEEVARMAQFASDSQFLFPTSVTFAAFLSKLEKVLPADTSLQELRFDQHAGTAVIVVESSNERSVTDLFALLERDGAYQYARLLKRSAVRIGTQVGSRLQIQLGLVGG